MNEFLYLTLNLGSLSIPLAYSILEKKFHFIQYFKLALISIFLMSIPFLIWDGIFTAHGVWGFNPDYHLSIYLAGMPIEEWMFFYCIPYACLFTHEVLKYYVKSWGISLKYSKYLTRLLQLLALVLVVLNYEKAYSCVNFLFFFAMISLADYIQPKTLARYFPTFLVILFPFFIVNGILTGSLLAEPVVWYNNDENLGLRIVTIPIEDFFYAFSLLIGVQLIFNRLKNRR
jgi:lycopene cyclase domain-containing protein